MGRIQFIEHKGKQLLQLDLCSAEGPEVVQVVRDAHPLIAAHPEKSLRTLTDVTNINLDSETTEALKQFARQNKPYVIAGAVVGGARLKRIVYNAVRRFAGRRMAAFETVDEAKDWLVNQ